MSERNASRAVAYGLLLAGLVYAAFSPLRSHPTLGTVSVVALVAIAVLLSVGGLSVQRIAASRTTLLVGMLVTALVCYHVATNPYYPLSRWSTGIVVDRFAPLLVVFWFPVALASWLPDDRRRLLGGLFRAHVIATVVVAIFVLLVGFGVVTLPEGLYRGSRIDIQYVITTYPIQTHTIFMVYVVPAVVYLLGLVLRGRRRISAAGVLGVVLAAALLSQIRKVYIALVVAVVAYLLFDDRYRKPASIGLVAGSPLVITGLVFAHRIEPASTSSRIASWTTQIPFALRHPLGTGHSGFQHFDYAVVGGHNIFVRVFSDYGVVAFLLLAAALGYTALRATRVCSRTSNVSTMSLGAAVLGLLVGLQFESPYYLDRFWFLVALFHVHADLVASSGETTPSTVADEPARGSATERAGTGGGAV